MDANDLVGVRELRQNLSVYLERVMAGEVLRVTEHGRPIAVLAPLPRPASAIGRLVASGRAAAPMTALDELGAPRGRVNRRASQALAALRQDER